MNSISIYLYVNAALYLIFSVWCAVKFNGSAKFLGYSFINNSGKAEYSSLYIGMQAGFAVFLAATAYLEAWMAVGLFFCVAIYAGIVVARAISGFYFKQLEKATFLVGSLELSLLVWGLLLIINQNNIL